MGVCCAERHTENSHAAPALLSLPPDKHRVGREQILGLCERGEHSVPGLDSKSPDSSKPQQRVMELAKRYQRVLRQSLGREKQDPCCCVLTVSVFHLAFLKKARLGFDRKEIFSEVLLNLYLLFKENIRVFTENGSNSVEQGFCKYLTLVDVLFTF